MNPEHIGSSLDEFLAEEGLLADAEAVARKRLAGRKDRDFSLRTDEEQEWIVANTWCDICDLPDLGMVEPHEYEEGGHVFVEGLCRRCGSTVRSQIVDESSSRDNAE